MEVDDPPTCDFSRRETTLSAWYTCGRRAVWRIRWGCIHGHVEENDGCQNCVDTLRVECSRGDVTCMVCFTDPEHPQLDTCPGRIIQVLELR